MKPTFKDFEKLIGCRADAFEDSPHMPAESELAPFGPIIIGGTGGSGTRVVARIVRHGGMFIGTRLNESEDALDLAAYSNRWINRFMEPATFPRALAARIEMTKDLKAVLANHLASLSTLAGPWGWKEPRSIYLLPFFHSQFSGMRFLHVIRDGRDMAFSANQNQLNKHGTMLLEPIESQWSAPLRSIALWNRLNALAADYGEGVLPGQYMPIRFEDLCAEPVPAIQRIFEFLGLRGDVEKIARLEVASPESLGRWRNQDQETLAELHRIGEAALRRFNYWTPEQGATETVAGASGRDGSYQGLVERIREVACKAVPPAATVIVVSKGDEELLKLGGRRAWHFPQAADGAYAGSYPANSASAIAHLEMLRAKGGDFLLFPKPSLWWLEHYKEFNQHLERRYRLLAREDEVCLIFELRQPEAAARESINLSTHQTNVSARPQFTRQIRQVVRSVLPDQATVLVASEDGGALLELEGRTAWHFPQGEDGAHIGHHPADSGMLIAQLESLRAKGAEYLLLPSNAFWWMEHYQEFKRHLRSHCRVVACQQHICVIFALQGLPTKGVLQRLSEPEVGNGRSVGVETGTTPDPLPRRPGNRTKRKVLYVCHNHPMVMPGGAEIYALELYEAMRASDAFEPILLARTGSPVPTSRCSHSGGPFAQLSEDPNQHLFYTKTCDFDVFYMAPRKKETCTADFHEFLLAHRPDVVHFQHTLFLGCDLIGQTRRTLPGAAIVYTLQEYLPICHRNGQMVRSESEELCCESSPRRCHECFRSISPPAFFRRKRFIQSHFSFVDLFLAPSRFLLHRYVEWGIPREKIRYEEYGRRGLSRPEEAEEERPRNRLGFFGQLNPFKGLNVLLEAMRILGSQKPGGASPIEHGCGETGPRASGVAGGLVFGPSNVHLWIHGANLELQGQDFQKEFRLLLEATKQNVTSAGRYDRAELPRLMANIDWVVVPSTWWENSPLVI